MDLSGLKSNDQFEFYLRHPVTDEPTDILVGVYGSDSRKYKAVSHSLKNEVLSGGKRTSESAEARGLKLIAQCVYRLDNCIIEGEEIAPDPKGVERVCKEYPWAKDQIDQAIHRRDNFLPGAPTS